MDYFQQSLDSYDSVVVMNTYLDCTTLELLSAFVCVTSAAECFIIYGRDVCSSVMSLGQTQRNTSQYYITGHRRWNLFIRPPPEVLSGVPETSCSHQNLQSEERERDKERDRERESLSFLLCRLPPLSLTAPTQHLVPFFACAFFSYISQMK